MEKNNFFGSLKKEVGSGVGSGVGSRSGSSSQRYGSADLHKKVTDPQHWLHHKNNQTEKRI
jgi:hypothetical protein